MSKFRKIVSTLLLLGVIGGIARYFLKDVWNGIVLETPVLEIDTDTTTVKWKWDMNAESYKLYDNVTLLDTFTVSEDPINKYEIDFSDYLTDYKRYDFKVVAYIDEKTYKESNLVTYLHQDPNIADSGEYGVLVNNETLAPQNIAYNDFVLSWDTVEDATKYYVCAIYGADDIYTIEVKDATSLNVFNYMAQEITAFRVGANMGGANTYFGEMITINLTNVEDIYKKTYYFNGEFHDYYINSSEELVNVLYYSFIAKDSIVYVEFSPTGLASVMGSDTYLTDAVISEYIDAITETCYYSFESPVRQTKYKYKFEFDFKNVIEPSNDSTNVRTSGHTTTTLTQSDLMRPYYENYSFSDRTSDTIFVSDNQMILVPVETSEELYWCVESGATPTFASETSTAYTLYNIAKDVLIDTLSHSMTTYQKILSIYDYICYNSVYDYKVVEDSAKTNSFNSTIYKCFYLESILNNRTTKLAVCDGYSKTFSLLCNMEGIDCYRVTGVARTSNSYGAHAWNKVKLGNNWYAVDITWTEYTLTDENSTQTSQHQYEVLGHKYFLVNDNFIRNDHFAYSDEDDRNRFLQQNSQISFNTLFPTVYMSMRNHDSTEVYDYFTNTNLGLGGIDRYIEDIAELSEFREYMATRSDTNLEIILDASLDKNTNSQVSTLLSLISTYGYEVYSTGSVTYTDSEGTISGNIYIFTSLGH